MSEWNGSLKTIVTISGEIKFSDPTMSWLKVSFSKITTKVGNK